jgi:hypothetical protein
LKSVKHPQRICGRQVNLARRNLKAVGFILAWPLDHCTRSCSMNREARFVEDRLTPKLNSGFSRKYVQEALSCSFQPRFFIPCQDDAKIFVNQEFTIASHNLCRQRHHWERFIGLRANDTRKGKRANGK